MNPTHRPQPRFWVRHGIQNWLQYSATLVVARAVVAQVSADHLEQHSSSVFGRRKPLGGHDHCRSDVLVGHRDVGHSCDVTLQLRRQMKGTGPLRAETARELQLVLGHVL